MAKDKTLEEIKNEYIQLVMRKYNGNVALAAESLGITRQSIYNKLRDGSINH